MGREQAQVTVAIEPWSVWWVDFEPVLGREQGGRRPAVVVSSAFHLRLTGATILNVLPVTTRFRPGWEHHVPLDMPGKPPSFVLTEQLRTVSRNRIGGHRPICAQLAASEIAQIRTVLHQMIAF